MTSPLRLQRHKTKKKGARSGFGLDWRKQPLSNIEPAKK